MLEQLKAVLVAKAQEQRLPVSLRGEPKGVLDIGHYCVMLAALLETPDRLRQLEAIDSLLRKALVFRGTLSQAGASDFNLFLVAPPGSAGNPNWENLAAEIESDDRVCRKLVWLPDIEGGEIERFLDRSFLARPWQSNSPTVGVDALQILGTALDMPEGWEEALLEADLSGRELIQRLMEIEAKL